MLYEAVLVFDSSLSDSDVGAQLDKVEAIITQHEGQVTKRDIWGRRQLAYKIRKKDYGIYCYLVLSGSSGLVADLRRQLRINDQVLRFLIVKKDKFAPDLLRPPVSDSYSSSPREPFYNRESNFSSGERFSGERFSGERDGGEADAPQADEGSAA